MSENKKKTRNRGLNLLVDKHIKSVIQESKHDENWPEIGKRLSDGGGLDLKVKPGGKAFWYFRPNLKIVKDGKLLTKRSEVSFGPYEQMTLAQARERAILERQNARQGIKPRGVNSAVHVQAPGGPTFAEVHTRWIQNWTKKGKAIETVRTTEYRNKKYLLDKFGDCLFAELEYSHFEEIGEILTNEGKNKKRGTLDKLIFSLSLIAKYAELNEVPGYEVFFKNVKKLKGNYARVESSHHYAAATTIDDIRDVLNKFKNAFSANEIPIKIAIFIRLIMLIFVRGGELRVAKWEDVDLNKRVWQQLEELPGSTKGRAIVPLSEEAWQKFLMLKKLYPNSKYLFPSDKTDNAPMSIDKTRRIMHKIGLKDVQTLHGFRATATTILSEYGFSESIIDWQLAHKPGRVKAAYDRSKHIEERRKMLDWWSLALDAIEAGNSLPDPGPYQKTF